MSTFLKFSAEHFAYRDAEEMLALEFSGGGWGFSGPAARAALMSTYCLCPGSLARCQYQMPASFILPCPSAGQKTQVIFKLKAENNQTFL